MPAFKNSIFKIVLLLTLLSPFFTNGQVWQMLNVREEDQISTSYTGTAKITLSPTGIPFVIYQDSQSEQKAIVKKFVSGKWEIVGNEPVSEDYTLNLALSFSPDGSLYATYQCVIEGPGSRVNVKKLINNRWVSVGKAGINADLHPSLAFASDGTPYIAFSSNSFNGGVAVRKFENANWVPVGTSDYNSISLKVASFNKLVNYNNEFYLAYSDGNNGKKCIVKKLVNNIWTTIGTEAVSDGQAEDIDICFNNNGILHIIYQDGVNENKITVKKFENDKWQTVGTPGLSSGASRSPNILFTKNNTPIIFYTDISLGNKAIFSKFINNQWTSSEVTPNTTAFHSVGTTMRIDANDNIYVSYIDESLNYRTTVKKLVDNKWEGVGINGISPEGTTEVKIKTDMNDIPYLAYIDINDKKASVKKYVNGNWQTVGSPSFTSINTKFIDLNISLDNLPYLLYRDDEWNVRLKKFNGIEWIAVGSALTIHQSYALKFAIAADGAPYVVYADGGTGGKIIVKKFDGTTWITVGNTGFSKGSSFNVGLAISKKGSIYLAYTDETNNITVRKLTDGIWQLVGESGFTKTTEVNGISLVISDDETPYLAYCDGGDSKRAKVKKFISVGWTDVGAPLSIGNSRSTSIILSKSGDPIVAYQDSRSGFKTATSIFKNGTWLPIGGEVISISETSSAELTIDKNGDIYIVYACPQAIVAKLVSGLTLPPKIYSLNPARAFQGNKVTIIGDNFVGTTDVRFGGKSAASFTVLSPKEIIAEVGNGESGDISVTTPLGQATKGDFIFIPHPPIITRINPVRNAVGTSIEITGSNFSPIKDHNVVYFGPVKAEVLSATETSLQVIVPAYSAYNIVSVTVNNETAYSPMSFLVKPTKSTSTIDASTFEPKIDFPTVSNTQIIKLADIDGDGKPDIIHTNDRGLDAFSVFLNQSTPSNIRFAKRTDIPCGSSPTALTIVDADGDGKLDILLPNPYGATLSYYRNTSTIGNISFANVTSYGQYIYPFGVDASDLDKDGRPDFICAAMESHTIFVNRNVAFADSYLYIDNKIAIDKNNIPYWVKAEDLNGDGYPEIISTSSSGIFIHQNLSTPGNVIFNPKLHLDNTDYQTTEINTADLDNDNKPEIITVNPSIGQIAIYKNLSTTTAISFGSRQLFTSQKEPKHIVAGDFNGDGLLDLATVNFQSNTASVFRNTSTAGSISMANPVNFPIGKNPMFLTTGDIDGDGLPDLISTSLTDNTFSILKNSSNKILVPVNNFSIAVKSSSCVAAKNGEIKIKGDLDLNYIAEITDGTDKKEYSFTKEVYIANLKAGTYTITVYIKDQPTDFRIFKAIITEPKPLDIKTLVESETGKLNLKLDGADIYRISLNGQSYTTTQNSISLPLNIGENTLQIKTDLECQGIFNKQFTYRNEVKLFPTPFDQILNISINKPLAKEVIVKGYTAMGTFSFEKKYANVMNELNMDLSNLNPGIYLLTVNIDGIQTQHKAVKK